MGSQPPCYDWRSLLVDREKLGTVKLTGLLGKLRPAAGAIGALPYIVQLGASLS